MSDTYEELALILDSVEADLVMLQHRVYRVRQALEKRAGKKVGFQYDDEVHGLVPKRKVAP